MFQNDVSDLFDLIRLGVASGSLKIWLINDSLFNKNVMASFRARRKSKPLKQGAHLIEADVSIAPARKHPFQYLVSLAHLS